MEKNCYFQFPWTDNTTNPEIMGNNPFFHDKKSGDKFKLAFLKIGYNNMTSVDEEHLMNNDLFYEIIFCMQFYDCSC